MAADAARGSLDIHETAGDDYKDAVRDTFVWCAPPALTLTLTLTLTLRAPCWRRCCWRRCCWRRCFWRCRFAALASWAGFRAPGCEGGPPSCGAAALRLGQLGQALQARDCAAHSGRAAKPLRAQ